MFGEDSHLSLSQDGVIKDIIHFTGRSALLHLSPESHAAFLKQLYTHFIVEGNNWRNTSGRGKSIYCLIDMGEIASPDKAHKANGEETNWLWMLYSV